MNEGSLNQKRSLKNCLAFALNEVETPVGFSVNLSILGLILLSGIIFVAETYSIPADVNRWLHRIDQAILYIFALEYALRFWCAENKIEFIFNFFSLIDLLSIFPLLVGFIDVLYLRILRWFRLLRVLRLVEFKTSIFNIKPEDSIILIRIFLSLFSLVFIYSGTIYQIENKANPDVFDNFFDALYFSIVTMTTVGFGDIIPLSTGGKIVTILMILSGILLIPWQIGLLTQQLLRMTSKTEKVCSSCGLYLHERDANFCKICGTELPISNTQSS